MGGYVAAGRFLTGLGASSIWLFVLGFVIGGDLFLLFRG